MVVPELAQTTDGLKSITRDLSKRNTKDIADLYVHAVSLLCHLKVDQDTLHEYEQKEDVYSEGPPPEKIPAVTAVLQDAGLFRGLLKCLQLGHEADHQHHLGHGSTSTGLVAQRKRSLSTSGDPVSNKSFKLTHSPVPTSSRVKSIQLSQAPGNLHKRADKVGKPSFNIPVLAATILYTAFQHVDHWPAPLVKAYADDCFGPRSWVDDKRCRLLVDNLSLAHEKTAFPPATSQHGSVELMSGAQLVARAYQKFEQTPEENGDRNAQRKGPPATSPTKQTPGASLTKSSPEKLKRGSASKTRKRPRDGDSSNRPATANAQNKGKAGGDSGDGGSSSSGEEDEEAEEVAVVTAKSPPGAAAKSVQPQRFDLYPIPQCRLNLLRVRQRFFGANLDCAHNSISSSLSERLDVRSKQNSGLLQTLPSFTAVPAVRGMVAENLEKWLQSPALAGLARNLFASTVQNMKNIDPPLEADLRAVDSILDMRLKANQLNAHIENITAIAKGIPTSAVALRMYSKLMPAVMVSAGTLDLSSADELKMVVAIHRAMPPQISYDALAATLLTLLVHRKDNGGTSAMDRSQHVKKLRAVIRALAIDIGSSFDGCALIKAFLSFDVSGAPWSICDEEDKARLMFQSVTMHASLLASATSGGQTSRNAAGNGLSSTKNKMQNSLLSARKSLLSWCCTDYGPRCTAKVQMNRRNKPGSDGMDLAGAGAPDFHSALGPARGEEKIPAWLNTMRCLLFLEDADSSLMKQFVFSESGRPGDEAETLEELVRIRLCCDLGANIDDEMIWIVIRACSSSQGALPPHVAIELLENLFECCAGGRSGSLKVNDPTIVWELYDLVEYTPAEPIPSSSSNSGSDQLGPDGRKEDELPRLAYPGLWWRVTMLALVLSGSSTRAIGNAVWNESPTAQSLVKMIVSNKYRFPTIDCDDGMREEMKRLEQAARDEETRIAERLFLPTKKNKDPKSQKLASRISKRLLKQKQEKEAAREVAEWTHRKKLLRAAQKSIMLWDPDGPARKPPREAADILLSVENLFGLSDSFQRSIEPDLLLQTIGGTSRGAIERAYDWLIPIISKMPGTIGRLPSSASCFLLLRAYGTDGEERNQLKELSAPLLSHVANCLKGKHGESDSVRAFDLLMSDVASHKAERRRCARRVLYEALQQTDSFSSTSWLSNILKLEYAEALVADAIKYMHTAATFDRGRVLCSLVMALEEHIAFAESKSIDTGLKFPDVVVELVSSRPSVFAEAMDSFPPLRSLVIRVVHSLFFRCAQSEAKEGHVDLEGAVVLNPRGRTAEQSSEIRVPLPVILSISVVLSIWKDTAAEDESAPAISSLVDALMRVDVKDNESESDVGLASAAMADSGLVAVSVESWIMLAKARSDTIARRAALSAPIKFLPRLLLCSGLPRASLVTMIDRLGHLGDAAAETDEVYTDLLASSASNDWDVGRGGQRREVTRKLLGRLAAYTRLNGLPVKDDSTVSTTFLKWLSRKEWKNAAERPKKTSQRKKSKAAKQAPSFSEITSASLTVKSILSDEIVGESSRQLPKSYTDTLEFIPVEKPSVAGVREAPAKSIIENGVKGDDGGILEAFLNRCAHPVQPSKLSETEDTMHPVDVCVHLLRCFDELSQKNERAALLILKWIPLLSREQGSTDFWKLLFSASDNPMPQRVRDDVITVCVSCWIESHVEACVSWVSSIPTDASDYCFLRLTRFLASTSCSSPGHLGSFSDQSAMFGLASWCGGPKENAASRTATDVAIRSLSDEKFVEDSYRRNGLPASTSLLLQIACADREKARNVTDSILECMSSSSTERPNRVALEAVLLRIYLRRPHWLQLGKAAVRSALVSAVTSHSNVWSEWRSTFDDQLENMLEAFVAGDLRLTRPFQDLSRSHPLIVLRKIPEMILLLTRDATTGSHHESDSRVVRGQGLAGPRETNFNDRTVRVAVRHWGYCYTESLWVAFLDVFAGIPKEVMFNCGLDLGVLDYLSIYLQLMSVQLQLRTADKAARLKGKLMDCFAAFQRTSPSSWRQWLSSSIGRSEVRHVLMSCEFISPQEALESLKPPTAACSA